MPPENQFNNQNLNQKQDSPKSKNTLLWVVVVIVILLLAGVVAGYFVFNTEREVAETQIESEETVIDTSDWQTHRNEEFGFEFKYPRDRDWKLGENFAEAFNQDVFYVSVRDPRYTVGEAQSHGSSVPTTYFNVTVYYDVLPAERSECVNTNWGLGLGRWVKNACFKEKPNTRIYMSVVNETDIDETNDEKSTFDQILSTFKFFGEYDTSDTSTSSVQDWQTHRNEEYGFEFKYPTNSSFPFHSPPILISDPSVSLSLGSMFSLIGGKSALDGAGIKLSSGARLSLAFLVMHEDSPFFSEEVISGFEKDPDFDLVTADGYLVSKYNSSRPGDLCPGYEYIFEREEWDYAFSYSYSDERCAKYDGDIRLGPTGLPIKEENQQELLGFEEIMDKMISTFKFTNK